MRGTGAFRTVTVMSAPKSRYGGTRQYRGPKSNAPEQPRVFARGDIMGNGWADYEFPPIPARGGPSGHAVITFNAPSEVVSVNETNGWHWSKRNTVQQLWRHAAYDAAETAADRLVKWRGHRVALTFALPVPNNGARRDSVNYGASSPLLKGAIDGITQAGVLVPNDTDSWLICHNTVLWLTDAVEVRVKIETAPWFEEPEKWV